MAVLQENIFDIVKRAKSKDFTVELRNWKNDAYTFASLYQDQYKNGMIFKQFESIEDSFKTIEEQRKKLNKKQATEQALLYVDGK